MSGKKFGKLIVKFVIGFCACGEARKYSNIIVNLQRLPKMALKGLCVKILHEAEWNLKKTTRHEYN